MTDTETTEVLGRPVTGEITRPASTQKEQKRGEYFLPLIDAVLALPIVSGVRWTQSTPYWNDGEPCVFGLGEVQVKVVDNDEGGDGEDRWLDDYDLREHAQYPGYQELHAALNRLSGEMDHFEVFLNKSFGDHATVTATREGFAVEFYKHD